jgi:hypothetical protein
MTYLPDIGFSRIARLSSDPVFATREATIKGALSFGLPLSGRHQTVFSFLLPSYPVMLVIDPACPHLAFLGRLVRAVRA